MYWWVIQSDQLLLFAKDALLSSSKSDRSPSSEVSWYPSPNSFVRSILPRSSWAGAVCTGVFSLRLWTTLFGPMMMTWSHWLGHWLFQEGSGDLQKGYPSVTKGASSSAKHPSKVPFTKAWRELQREVGKRPSNERTKQWAGQYAQAGCREGERREAGEGSEAGEEKGRERRRP